MLNAVTPTFREYECCARFRALRRELDDVVDREPSVDACELAFEDEREDSSISMI